MDSSRINRLDNEKQMKRIKLTKRFYTLVDNEDFERATKHKWVVSSGRSNTRYAQGSNKIDGVKKTTYLHRFLLDAPKGMQVDHINGNGLDNRKSNLRLCTQTENQRNSYKHRQGTPVGVCRTTTGYYKAQVTVKGKLVYIGIRKTQEEAIKLREEFIKALIIKNK